MKNKSKNDKTIYIAIMIFGLVLMLNVVIAAMNPGYKEALSQGADRLISSLSTRTVFLDERSDPALMQGGEVKGINLQKVGEDTKKKTQEATGGGAAAGKAKTGEIEEPEEPAPATPQKKGAPAPKKKKAAPTIDPKVLEKAFVYFNESLLNRDVIQVGQSDKLLLGEKTIEKPYISKSFRDNPFDEVQEIDINPGITLKKLPEPPFYPPPGGTTVSVTAEEFKKYVETLQLRGVIVIDDKFYAIIRSGPKTYYKMPGDDYKEKFNVNVEDVTVDTVIVSDEFGNKGILDFDFRRGYQVQPLGDAIFITNLGQK